MSSVLPPALLNPLHLVLGDSAAGCVRAACTSWGMPGTVTGFAGDLAQGPLDDAALLSQWQALMARLDLERPDALIVWHGDNVADASFVAMACDQLAMRSESLLGVRVPGVAMRPYVTMHAPEQIAQMYAGRRPLSAAQRLALARDFVRIRDTCRLVRRLEQGRVVEVPINYYDPLLLAACTPHWQAAGHVVGAAMAGCDAPNLLGDGFFSERLGFLVDAGQIEAKGPGTTLRDDWVRLANGQTHR